MWQLISNFLCRKELALLRPMYKPVRVRGYFSVGSLLLPVASPRKIRVFIFKNILSPLLKKVKTVSTPEKRQTAFVF